MTTVDGVAWAAEADDEEAAVGATDADDGAAGVVAAAGGVVGMVLRGQHQADD